MVDEFFYREHFSKLEKNQDFEEEKDENNFNFLLSDFKDEKEEENNIIEEKKLNIDEKKNLIKLTNEEKNGKIIKNDPSKSDLLSLYLEFNISELLITNGTKRWLLYQENLMRIGAVNVDFMEGIIIKIFKNEVFIIKFSKIIIFFYFNEK